MNNMLKDKENHIVDILFDDKNKGPKEKESYEDTIDLFEIVATSTKVEQTKKNSWYIDLKAKQTCNKQQKIFEEIQYICKNLLH